MLLLISAITFNALGDNAFHEEWRRVNRDFNMDELMKGQDSNGKVIDLRSQTHHGIDHEVLGSSSADTANVESSVKDKRPQELQAEGRQAMYQNQEVTNLLGDLQKNVDRSQPGVDSISKKADKIAAKHASMADNLSQYLKEKYGIDIECTSTPDKQSGIDNPFIMGEETQEIPNETYEPQYCEQLLNTYNCTTDLHISCLKPGGKPFRLDIQEANFGYNQESNLIHINHTYPNESFTRSYGKSLDTYHILDIAELRLVFNVHNLEILNSVALTDINFSHALLVQVNGHNLYPAHWGDLKAERSPRWDDRGMLRGKSYHMGSSRHSGGSVIYNDMYPRLDYATGSLVIQTDTRPDNHIGDIDLTRFIKLGRNELIIKGGSIRNNYIRAILRSSEKACLKWSEKWVETCALQPS